MPYPPIQMNKTHAAEYCGVSIKIFTSRYQPRLTAREDGNLYFWTREIDELIKQLFEEERQKLKANLPKAQQHRQATKERANGSALSQAMRAGR